MKAYKKIKDYVTPIFLSIVIFVVIFVIIESAAYDKIFLEVASSITFTYLIVKDFFKETKEQIIEDDNKDNKLLKQLEKDYRQWRNSKSYKKFIEREDNFRRLRKLLRNEKW